MTTDADLVDAAADITAQAHGGHPLPASVVSLLRSIATTRDQARRQELARQAEERARQRWGEISAVALQVLRIGIFALA